MESEGRKGRRARYAGQKAEQEAGPPIEGPPAPVEAVARLGEPFTGYLAAPDREETLNEELGGDVVRHGRLLLAPGPPRDVAWALNVWRDPRRIPFVSIRDAARRLKGLQRSWAGYPLHMHRRAALISEGLPHVSARPLRFPDPAPIAPLGSWTLLDRHTILASPTCSNPFPNGEVRFEEDRESPPSRAYLKLWEVFTLVGVRPGPGERCLDLGASPGGWTWVLQSLGARVIAVDKAPLEPRISSLPGVEERRGSAFALDPAAVGSVDWLLSDMACYPSKLLGLVRRWLDAGAARRAVCTLKFQGETDHDTARAFAAIPGSRLLHLHNNRHELTWVKI
ncbi:MAG: SAM-dependent methyltransferase [Pseudomonadota bacterium]